MICGRDATLRAWALCAALLAQNPGAAGAHAIILESDPAAGAKVADPPTRIYLRFNSKIEKRLSHVTLTAADGRPVPVAVKADGSEKPDRIVLPLGSLRPGAYVVRYKVLAADGHITEGALRFTVLEPK
ncbi:MAG TPA: copper resistance CopC family protein [Methylomirabilota bacterium]|nr:copper resistance CopC family protein [Methylomirabilota bacterium]